MTAIRTLSDASHRDLRDLLEKDRQRRLMHLGEVVSPGFDEAKQVRWGKTTTNSANPSYPSAPANKFVVRFGELVFSDTSTGNETVTFAAYDTEYDRICWSPIGYIPQNTVVRVMRDHGRWYIVPPQTRFHAQVSETGGIDPNSSGEVTIYMNKTATTWTVTAYFDWVYGDATLAEDSRVIVQWYPDRNSGAGEWVIELPWC
jgi:hypothetical protein